MPVFTETNRIGDVLKREFDPLHNRDTVVLASGQNLKCGAVVGVITASGKFTATTAAANNGSQTAAGVLLFDTDASSADTRAVVLRRGPAVVAVSALIFEADVTAENRAAAIASLASLGIMARAAV